MASSQAYGDVGVVLNESLATSVDRITGSGHSAVYLSRICPDSPVKLRLCGPGEQGSVISTYTNPGEDYPFEWNAVPLSVFLYGVDDPRNRPLFGSAKIKRVLEDQYRAKYLTEYCTTRSCQTSNSAEWRLMVGASLSRGIYIFVAETTEEDDRKLIAEFNSIPNVNHFNGVTRNCADFTQHVINTYFPHAARTDYLNDFGMTSPKAIARSFTRYALRHPETHFRVLHFAQVPGTIKRSSEVRDGTEQLYHSKKLLVPMAVFAAHALPVVTALYVLTGRFNPEREAEKYPTAEITEIRHQIRLAKADEQDARARQLSSLERELRADAIGDPREWKAYRQAFDAAVDDSVHHETIPDRQSLNRVFKRLDEAGTFLVDENGALWAEFPDADGSPRLGLSASNILSSDSDSRLAGELLLARVARVLKSPKHGRESILEFKNDWMLLQDAGRKSSIFADRGGAPAASEPTVSTPSGGSY
ncbi:MAG: hypothetical protein LAN64_20500 [Acidobacteriia bacterium]|nr:hypothetical protein [Terriglobia bacterium]